jgi:hypothetical protein
MGEEPVIWILLDEDRSDPHELAVRVCGTALDFQSAQAWALSRQTRNSIRVPLDALAEGEVL